MAAVIDVQKAQAALKTLEESKATLKEMGGIKLVREYVALSASKDRMAEIEAKVASDKAAGQVPEE